MQPDARIVDVIHALDDPVEYVRGIVGSFYSFPFDKDVAVVRIGVSGKGRIPNYSIEEYGETVSTTLPSGGSISTNIRLRHCFHGRHHKEILDDSFRGEKWSSASMSFAEVQSLLGHLRDKGGDRH
jgi:hypothetical protein